MYSGPVCNRAFTFIKSLGVTLTLCVSLSSVHADLTDLSIEQLMQIDVNLVSRKPQKLMDAPAAVYVLTSDDIRNSGATSIPEALRLVPGLSVARIDASKWAIGMRGFNGRFARHILVQIDGRTIYTPLFSGVIWEDQGILLDNIDRIEVIRGPGGTMWGANAVNGIINIVTKSARDTQGTLVNTVIGTEYKYGVSARQGVALSTNAWLQIYAKADAYDSARKISGGDANDDWNSMQGGFRLDWNPTVNDPITIQGDYRSADLSQTIYVPAVDSLDIIPVNDEPSVNSGNLMLHYGHTFDPESKLAIRLYYDFFRHTEHLFSYRQNTIDLDLQHFFPLGERQQITWGAGYRALSDKIKSAPTLVFDDYNQQNGYSSLFLQDRIRFVDDRLNLYVGTKLEHNPYTDFEWEPSIRLAYTLTENNTFWGSVSRSVRTPSRAERTMDFTQNYPAGLLSPGIPAVKGWILHSNNFKSENMIAYELGWRANLLPNLSIDLATFIYDYDDLRSVEINPVPIDDIYYARLGNTLNGLTHGFEITSHWQALDWWRLVASWSYAKLNITHTPGSRDMFGEDDYEDNLPENQFSLFSTMQLPNRVSLNAFLLYVDSIDDGDIPSYTTLDLQLAWQISDNITIALVGQNLLDRSVLQYGQSTIVQTELTEAERSVYTTLTLSF